jgi:hypothetical protein
MSTTSNFFEKTTLEELRGLKGKERQDLMRRIWPESKASRSAFDDFACEAMMEHVVRELYRVRQDSDEFAAQNFDAMFIIIQALRRNNSKHYKDIVRDLLIQFSPSTPDAVRRSVELTLRIWLTVNANTLDIFVGPILAGRTIDWPNDVSLADLLQRRYEKGGARSQRIGSATFEPTFTATYLINTCGVKLQWTDDILSHLNFDFSRLILTVYRHKACILGHLDGPADCPFPKDVFEEILDTMDLLFPPWDDSTKDLLRRKGQQSLYTLGCRRGDRILEVGHYRYFGEALERIFESFNKAPRTWRQLALDRRNKLEWSAFWVTVMVAILTVVSIPCNLIQATYSVKAYRVALTQASDTSQGRG